MLLPANTCWAPVPALAYTRPAGHWGPTSTCKFFDPSCRFQYFKEFPTDFQIFSRVSKFPIFFKNFRYSLFLLSACLLVFSTKFMFSPAITRTWSVLIKQSGADHESYPAFFHRCSIKIIVSMSRCSLVNSKNAEFFKCCCFGSCLLRAFFPPKLRFPWIRFFCFWLFVHVNEKHPTSDRRTHNHSPHIFVSKPHITLRGQLWNKPWALYHNVAK